MKLARFLAELSIRARSFGRVVAEPVGALVFRIYGTLDGDEGRALAKGCLAIIEFDDDITKDDLEALGPDAIVLLDRFASERLKLRYEHRELALIAATVRELVRCRAPRYAQHPARTRSRRLIKRAAQVASETDHFDSKSTVHRRIVDAGLDQTR